MKIRLCYVDEYVEGKDDYSYKELSVDNWECFWALWNDASDFIKCDNSIDDKIIYLRKDCVLIIMGGYDNDDF